MHTPTLRRPPGRDQPRSRVSRMDVDAAHTKAVEARANLVKALTFRASDDRRAEIKRSYEQAEAAYHRTLDRYENQLRGCRFP